MIELKHFGEVVAWAQGGRIHQQLVDFTADIYIAQLPYITGGEKLPYQLEQLWRELCHGGTVTYLPQDTQLLLQILSKFGLLAEDTFMVTMGGNWFVCETLLDLKEIKSFALNEEGEWPINEPWSDVTQRALSFDAADYIVNDPDEAEYFQFLLCTNDSGGPSYFVPRDLWAHARVQEHFEFNGGVA